MESQPTARPAAAGSTAIVPYAWVILAVVYISSVAAPLSQFKVPPVMPVLMEAFNLSLSSAGLLMSVFAITGLVLALPSGVILQRWGLKTGGLIATGCLALGSLLGAFAASAGVMLFSRVIEGVGMGIMSVLAPAAIAMWFPPDKQGLPMGLWATWVPLGSITMYAAAPALAAAFGWQAVWWFSLAFAAVAFLLVLLFLRQPPVSETAPADGPALPMRQALRNRDLWLISLVFCLFITGALPLGTYYPTFLVAEHGLSLAAAALMAGLTGLVAMFTAPMMGMLSDRLGSRKLLFSWPFFLVAATMLFPFTIPLGWVPVWLIVSGVTNPAIPTTLFAAVPEVMRKPELAGIGMGAVSLGQNLGMVVGPMLFGALAENAGWAIAGYAMVPILLAGFFVARTVQVR